MNQNMPLGNFTGSLLEDMQFQKPGTGGYYWLYRKTLHLRTKVVVEPNKEGVEFSHVT